MTLAEQYTEAFPLSGTPPFFAAGRCFIPFSG